MKKILVSIILCFFISACSLQKPSKDLMQTQSGSRNYWALQGGEIVTIDVDDQFFDQLEKNQDITINWDHHGLRTLISGNNVTSYTWVINFMSGYIYANISVVGKNLWNFQRKNLEFESLEEKMSNQIFWATHFRSLHITGKTSDELKKMSNQEYYDFSMQYIRDDAIANNEMSLYLNDAINTANYDYIDTNVECKIPLSNKSDFIRELHVDGKPWNGMFPIIETYCQYKKLLPRTKLIDDSFRSNVQHNYQDDKINILVSWPLIYHVGAKWWLLNIFDVQNLPDSYEPYLMLQRPYIAQSNMRSTPIANTTQFVINDTEIIKFDNITWWKPFWVINIPVNSQMKNGEYISTIENLLDQPGEYHFSIVILNKDIDNLSRVTSNWISNLTYLSSYMYLDPLLVVKRHDFTITVK